LVIVLELIQLIYSSILIIIRYALPIDLICYVHGEWTVIIIVISLVDFVLISLHAHQPQSPAAMELTRIAIVWMKLIVQMVQVVHQTVHAVQEAVITRFVKQKAVQETVVIHLLIAQAIFVQEESASLEQLH